MNALTRSINLLLSIFLFTMTDVSVLYGADEDNFYAVATYECIGLYFKSPDLGQCNVRFTEDGTSKHRQGYPLVYDPRDKEYRGSIVGLKPHTNYAVEITLDNGGHELTCKTRNDSFSIGKTTYLKGGVSSKPLVVTESGSAKGYHLITPAENSRATIDVRNAQEYTCVIDADYIIANVWDDAIESEGANMNVRIWNNYIEKTFQHIATACTSKGPLYIFRNVFGESRRTHRDPLGGSMIKVGQRDEFGGGRKFVFHNTAIQPRGAFHVFSGHVNPNTVTRNNIFDCPGRLTSSRQVGTPCDFDYDLFTGMDRGIARERHGIRGNHSFIKSYALKGDIHNEQANSIVSSNLCARSTDPIGGCTNRGSQQWRATSASGSTEPGPRQRPLRASRA